MDVVAAAITTIDGGSIMAGGDRRGPRGMGPMTGRGMGYCAGNDRPGFVTDGAGTQARGFGRGPGGGFGRNRGGGFGGGFGPAFGRGYGRGWTDFHPQETRMPEYSDSIMELAEEAALLRDRLAVLEERLADQKNKD